MQNNPAAYFLPLEGKIRARTVMRVTGIDARSTIWRLEKAGKFPKSIRITPRLTVWDAPEVRQWLADPIGWAKREATKAKARDEPNAEEVAETERTTEAGEGPEAEAPNAEL